MIIYKATNNINGKVYIGLSTKTIWQRKSCHMSEMKRGRSSHLYFYRAIKKYGQDNFSWDILAETDSREKLKAMEKFYIAAYSRITELYNMTNGGEFQVVKYVLSNEQRKAISDRTKNRVVNEETKEKIRAARAKQIFSEESRIKKSNSLKGRPSPMKGKKQTEHCKQVSKNTASNHPNCINSRFEKGMTPWNKGKSSGLKQNGNLNNYYRHDIDNKDILAMLKLGLKRSEIADMFQCNQRTIDRRINAEMIH